MKRHCKFLRPKPSRAEDKPEELSLSKAPEVKKRRLDVSVACNTVEGGKFEYVLKVASEADLPFFGSNRAKIRSSNRSIQCDGQRPVCENCLGATTQCAYRDESDLSNESRKIVVELIRILNIMPAVEIIRALRLLGTETNAPITLSTLRDKARPRGDTLAGYYTSIIASDTLEPLEFEIQHSNAYPPVPRLDSKELEKELRAGQFRPTTQDWAFSSESQWPPDSVYETAYNLLSRSPSSTLGDRSENYRHASPPTFDDPRLQELDIKYWTRVGIEKDMAASCISLYLQTDHSLLGHFDPESFVSDLVSEQPEYCPSLLVNALLYWACQMYSAIERETDALAIRFCTEAERLWNIERENERDSYMNIAAAEFLCLGYFGQGSDHAIVTYVSEASSMGKRLGLFGTEDLDTIQEPSEYVEGADEAKKARMHTSWGVFNWITLSHPAIILSGHGLR